MINPDLIRKAARRFGLILLVSLGLVWLGSEIAFVYLRDAFDRPPETVALTIPYGTSLRVQAGLEEPGIPSELSFVVGDTLLVYNDDTVAHELGPLYIPPGASARLLMDDTSVFEYTCSFRPSQYLGLTINESTDLNIRLIAVAYVSPATAIIIFLYSLALRPIRLEDGKERS